MGRIWHRLFLEERPSIGLSFFRIAVALTVGAHVIPSFIPLRDTFLSTAFKRLDPNSLTHGFVELVQQSPDGLVAAFVALFCVAWFFFLVGLFSQFSCIVLTGCCYYFFALNAFPIGTLSWDILLVVLFLMCAVPYHGDYFSADALRKGDPNAFRAGRPFFLQRLLQVQIAFTYFYTGLYKISAAGNWLTGNPIHALMNYPPGGVTKWFLLRETLAVQPAVCYVIGVAIVLVELSMPVLLFWRKTLASAVYLGFLFHVMLVLTLDVPAIFFFLFPAQLLLFIPPEDVIRWIEEKRRKNAAGKGYGLVFDGKCAFCRASVEKLKVMDLFGALTYIDYHGYEDLKVVHPQLTREQAHSQLHLVSEGSLRGGFEAFRRICWMLPMLYPFLPIVYFPGSGIIGPWAYRWVANNRYLFHFRPRCRDNACFR